MKKITRISFLKKTIGISYTVMIVALTILMLVRDVFNFNIPLPAVYAFLDRNPWIFPLSLLLMVIIWLVIIYLAYPRDNELKVSEEETVLNLHRRVFIDSQKCLDEIESMKINGFLEEAINKVSLEIDNKIEEKKQNLESKVTEVIDDGYYKSALKSMLPFRSKQSHQALTNEKMKQVIDQGTLANEIKEVIANNHYKFLNSIKEKLSEVQGNYDVQEKKKFDDAIKRIIKNKKRFSKKFKGDVLVENIIGNMGLESRDEKQIAYALTIFPIAIVDEEIYTMAGEIVIDILSSNALSPLMQSYIVDQIKEFIIELVGEEALTEVLGAIGLAFTGIGAILLVFRFGRYGMIAKKLFYDKVPLQNIRKNAANEIRDNLNDFKFDVKFDVSNMFKEAFNDVENEYKKIIEKSKNKIGELKELT